MYSKSTGEEKLSINLRRPQSWNVPPRDKRFWHLKALLYLMMKRMVLSHLLLFPPRKLKGGDRLVFVPGLKSFDSTLPASI